MSGVRYWRVWDRGLHERCAILAGVTPFKSVGMARYMKNSVPGMDVPEEMIERLKGVGKENVGVRGIHIMAIEWEEKVAEIAKAAGLLPRPQL